MNKKEGSKLAVTSTQQKFAKSLARVPHSYREDGLVRLGDSVMIKNSVADGYLVCDMSDRINTHDEAYAVTCAPKMAACARSVYCITSADPNSQGSDDCVKYGMEVRVQSNPYILNKPLYLSSC